MTKTERLNDWVRMALSRPECEIDQDEVARALGILIDPREHHVLTALPSARSRVAHGTELRGAVETARLLSDERGTYYCLNPVAADAPDRKPNASAILHRCWLMVDVDRCKDVEPEASATDAEKMSVMMRAGEVVDWLITQDWPLPIFVDSGNGQQLIYRVNLPNDDLSKILCVRALKAIAKKFNRPGEPSVDPAVGNADRLAKLPGTWARRGENTPERPHRMARLLIVPESIEVVPVAALERVGGTAEVPRTIPDPPRRKLVVPRHASREDSYVRKAVEDELGWLSLAPDGERNSRLNAAAFALGQFVGAGQVNREEMSRQLSEVARRRGLTAREIEATVASGLDAGIAQPRVLPLMVEGVSRNGTSKPIPAKLTIGLDEITPEKVDWLWEERIAPGFITIFAGRTGLGKSFVTCDVAARLSRGEPAPYSALNCGMVRTLMISEDPIKQMLGPRLIELGAVRKHVRFMTWDAMGVFTLNNVNMLNQAYEECEHPGLLVIDPPSNFLGSIDEHKNAEIRAALKELVGWLDEHHVACVLITHINKAVGKGLDAVERIVGSIAWGSMARITLAFAKDPDSAQFLCGGTKNNIGRLAHPLAYRIVETDELARIEWVGKSDINIEDAMNKVKRKSRGTSAVEWLTGLFRERREWESVELKRMAGEVGVSKYALFESQEVRALPIDKRKRMNSNGDHYWVWIAEQGWPPECSVSSDSCSVSSNGATNIQDSDVLESRRDVNETFGT